MPKYELSERDIRLRDIFQGKPPKIKSFPLVIKTKLKGTYKWRVAQERKRRAIYKAEHDTLGNLWEPRD